MGVQPRRFTGKRIPELFLEDVGRYEALARELGATDVRVVGKKDVILDERVIARCYSPRCCYYGTNLNCPPHGPGIEEMRRVVDRYDTGLFLRMDVPPEEVADPDYDNPDKHKIPGARKMFEIVAKIQ